MLPYPYVYSMIDDIRHADSSRSLDRSAKGEHEATRLLDILARPPGNKNNPALLGNPSADRYAIITEVARRITDGDVAPALASRQVFALDMDALVRGTMEPSVILQRLRDLFETIGNPSLKNVLFVDNLHYLVGADMSRYPVDAAPLLKSALGHHQFQVLGALTLREYRTYIERDAALQRRFGHVFMD